jgi:hypothetical protein
MVVQADSDAGSGVAALTLTVRVEPGAAPQFDGRIDGSSVFFSFPGGNGGGSWYYYYYAPPPQPTLPPFSYTIDPTSQYTLSGQARGTKSSAHSVQVHGTINGAISVVDPSTKAAIAECLSTRHQFSLVRQ